MYVGSKRLGPTPQVSPKGSTKGPHFGSSKLPRGRKIFLLEGANPGRELGTPKAKSLVCDVYTSRTPLV